MIFIFWLVIVSYGQPLPQMLTNTYTNHNFNSREHSWGKYALGDVDRLMLIESCHLYMFRHFDNYQMSHKKGTFPSDASFHWQ